MARLVMRVFVILVLFCYLILFIETDLSIKGTGINYPVPLSTVLYRCLILLINYCKCDFSLARYRMISIENLFCGYDCYGHPPHKCCLACRFPNLPGR